MLKMFSEKKKLFSVVNYDPNFSLWFCLLLELVNDKLISIKK